MASFIRKASGHRMLLNVKSAMDSGHFKQAPVWFDAMRMNRPSARQGLPALRKPKPLQFDDDERRSRLLKKHPELMDSPFRRYQEARGFYTHPVDAWIQEHRRLTSTGGLTAKQADEYLETRLQQQRLFALAEADVHRRLALRRGKRARVLDDFAAELLRDVNVATQRRKETAARARREQLVRACEDRLTHGVLTDSDLEQAAAAAAAAEAAVDHHHHDPLEDGGDHDDDDDDGPSPLAQKLPRYLTADELHGLSRQEVLEFVRENPKYEQFFDPVFLYLSDFRDLVADQLDPATLDQLDWDDRKAVAKAVTSHLPLGDQYNEEGYLSDDLHDPVPINDDGSQPHLTLKEMERVAENQDLVDLDFFTAKLPFHEELDLIGLGDIDRLSEKRLASRLRQLAKLRRSDFQHQSE